jgi:hypothetical protein
MILDYDVHGAVKFRIVRKDPLYEFKPLEMEYSHFQTDKPISPDMTIRVGEFAPKNKGCYTVDHKYFIRKNYIYFKEPTWELEIEGFGCAKTSVNFWDKSGLVNTFMNSSLVLVDQVIRPLLEMKLASRGYVLTHSAAVSKDDCGILLCGPAASYKTSIAMSFVRSGYKLLGDDFSILKGKRIFSFPRTPEVFEYRISKLDTEDMTLMDKARIRMGYKKQEVKSIIDSSKLSLIIFPIMSNSNRFEAKRIDTKTAVKKIAINNELEDSFSKFYQYSLAYKIIFPKDSLWPNLEKIIDIRGIPCYTAKISKENFRRVVDFAGNLK